MEKLLDVSGALGSSASLELCLEGGSELVPASPKSGSRRSARRLRGASPVEAEPEEPRETDLLKEEPSVKPRLWLTAGLESQEVEDVIRSKRSKPKDIEADKGKLGVSAPAERTEREEGEAQSSEHRT